MALVRIPDLEKVISDQDEIKEYLAGINIGYSRWKSDNPVTDDSNTEEILEAYAREIEELKESGGYQTADVIDVKPETPNLDTMLAKFSREHWHSEDEVRFIIEGEGVFHIHPPEQSVVAIKTEAGDLIRVPAGTLHWFDLTSKKRIRAIRLFQDMTGWTPYYTDSELEKNYLPVCFGLTFIPSELQKF